MSDSWIDSLNAVAATNVAVVDGRETLTYGDLRRQARQLAADLVAAYGRGHMLVLRAASNAAFVRTLLAVMWSGNVPVPVDPDLPNNALDYIQQKSLAVGVLDPVEATSSAKRQVENYNREQPAIVVFTSGTSGFPKGVVVSDANLTHSCRTIASYLDYATFPSAAVVLPLYYSYALISQLLCQLSIGGRVRLFSDLRNPIKLAAAVEHEHLQTLCGVPSTFHALRTFHAMRPLSMPSVRVLCSAGASMETGLLASIREIFPNASFFNNYGMTEASPRIAFIRDTDPRFMEPTCGRPMAGVEVRIVDPQTEQELADRERGLLVVRGPNITCGYLNDAEQTARAFTQNGFLKSGDLAYMDDGYIFILGRYDDVFNCGGEKVAPLEIERVLNSCPGVEGSAVTGIEDEQRGMVPVAFVKVSADVRRKDLVSHLITQVSRSKIPLRYIKVSAFPTTSNGKLQRKRLSVADASYVVGELE